MKLFRALLTITLLLAVSSLTRAQEKVLTPPPPPPPPQGSLYIPVKVQVVFNEFDGDKKVSSLPYALHSMAEPDRNPSQSSLRMGIKVPITTMGKESQVQYMDVGTDVDCWVSSFADGTFRLRLSLRRSSLYSPSRGEGKQVEWKPGEPFLTSTPLLGSFTGMVYVVLRDGQTTQATVATDPVSGRTLKVDVSLNIAK